MVVRAAVRWVRRVRGSGQRERIHLYIRYTLYSMGVFEAGATALGLVATAADSAAWAVAAASAVALAHASTGVLLTRRCLAHYLDAGAGAERAYGPDRLVLAYCAATCLALAATGGAVAAGALAEPAMGLTVQLAGFGAGPLALARPGRRAFRLAAVPVLAGLTALVASGTPGGPLAGLSATMVVLAAVMAGTYRTSAWMLRGIDRLDAARETEGRLAVAEERLRFARDLHDVLGRNLSVIALKSELAARLAVRGSPAAVDQMTEVQRIARESQREIREVVRGYRAAGLHAELVGAQGVLEAAGIACRVAEEGGAGAPGALPAAAESALGWVVREGTTNVLRHADAACCTVRLRLAEGTAVLEMENDGMRAPSGSEPGAGSGLAGLRERLSAVGGTLGAGPAAGGGSFLLTARVPLRVPLPGASGERP
ncbi:histidine kinase [Streptomyces sp. DSM 44917]|uniref:Histidine kinase n=1 Tax=Streptomyces boetiae TaxID=3075541 RepID=A0ABU2LCS9_9ACTN|nr:histidine kinase [Streptomyces sp. DSM 44917]MDT0308978.1 histidine kinase [Streptomyces sp. DSM 44917]